MLEAKCDFLFSYFHSKGFLEFLVDWREDPKTFVIETPLISIYLSMHFLYLIANMNLSSSLVRFRV